MKLTDRELATILAALRFWQARGIPRHLLGIATNNGRVEPLMYDELNALCERLNTGD